MKISLSNYASGQTWVEISTKSWRKYTTDAFEKAIFQTLVWQEPGDTIAGLTIHRGTPRGQVERGDLEEKIKVQILALLPQ